MGTLYKFLHSEGAEGLNLNFMEQLSLNFMHLQNHWIGLRG